MKRRNLTKSEELLWAQVRRTVNPLKTGKAQSSEAAAADQQPAQEPTSSRSPKPNKRNEPTGRISIPAPVNQPKPQARLPVQSQSVLSAKEKRRFSRGGSAPDARIDLHGMRQVAAFHALLQFLRNAQASGDRIVLVITGKGGEAGSERGVLRRVVPQWLANSEFREIVSGVEPAARRHGGDGALYVRLRRKRQA